jgi:hypothetical protein
MFQDRPRLGTEGASIRIQAGDITLPRLAPCNRVVAMNVSSCPLRDSDVEIDETVSIIKMGRR